VAETANLDKKIDASEKGKVVSEVKNKPNLPLPPFETPVKNLYEPETNEQILQREKVNYEVMKNTLTEEISRLERTLKLTQDDAEKKYSKLE
jgi:acetamidase/formamidase